MRHSRGTAVKGDETQRAGANSQPLPRALSRSHKHQCPFEGPDLIFEHPQRSHSHERHCSSDLVAECPLNRYLTSAPLALTRRGQ